MNQKYLIFHKNFTPMKSYTAKFALTISLSLLLLGLSACNSTRVDNGVIIEKKSNYNPLNYIPKVQFQSAFMQADKKFLSLPYRAQSTLCTITPALLLCKSILVNSLRHLVVKIKRPRMCRISGSSQPFSSKVGAFHVG